MWGSGPLTLQQCDAGHGSWLNGLAHTPVGKESVSAAPRHGGNGAKPAQRAARQGRPRSAH